MARPAARTHQAGRIEKLKSRLAASTRRQGMPVIAPYQPASSTTVPSAATSASAVSVTSPSPKPRLRSQRKPMSQRKKPAIRAGSVTSIFFCSAKWMSASTLRTYTMACSRFQRTAPSALMAASVEVRPSAMRPSSAAKPIVR